MSARDGERWERDLLGRRAVPATAYYGVHTLRAVENFPLTGTPIARMPELVRALACVKQAAACANRELGLLDDERAEAIVAACEEVRAGHLHDQFVVDVIQGGAGTSTNMNANEVIANRALELLGRALGDYAHLSPLDHVNLGQSTNDVYPTAVRIALHRDALGLLDALATLREAFEAKAVELADVVKLGRTQLQDAVPMTLGRALRAHAVLLADDERLLREAADLLLEVNLGGTAIGTGMNAAPGYAALACRHLAEIAELPVCPAEDLVAATQDVGPFVHLSGVLRRAAVKLSKACNDLRLLSSGPVGGLRELHLPAVQAGSSIMPGKVNPVIPEAVNQVAFEVVGNDLTVTLAAEAGQLELNPFEPMIAFALWESLTHLRAACGMLAERCVAGIAADATRMRRVVESSPALATALSPHVGYALAGEIAQHALESGRSVLDVAHERTVLPLDELHRILSPEALARPAGRHPEAVPLRGRAR